MLNIHCRASLSVMEHGCVLISLLIQCNGLALEQPPFRVIEDWNVIMTSKHARSLVLHSVANCPRGNSHGCGWMYVNNIMRSVVVVRQNTVRHAGLTMRHHVLFCLTNSHHRQPQKRMSATLMH